MLKKLTILGVSLAILGTLGKYFLDAIVATFKLIIVFFLSCAFFMV